MSPRASRVLAAAAAAVLAATSLSLAAAIPAVAADGTVSGTVFQDYNANGVLDTGATTGDGIAIDVGKGGITVTAYDGAGGSWSTVSAADGTYSIPVVGAAGDTVRVEFTDLPTGYQHGAVASSGSQNGTAVQFVDLAAGSGVDFAINAPEDYSQGDAPLATTIQWAGSPFPAEGGTKAAEPALAAVTYDDNFTSAQPAGFPGRVTLATFGEIGATSSNVYQPSSNSMFVAATYKRQSGLGSLGLGGIYQVTDVMDATGAPSDAGVVVPWLDVESIGVDVGTALSNVARGISGHQTPTNDPDGFAQAAKVGIGDMVLSPDGQTLYFINLFDKQLYSLDVSDSSTPPTSAQSYDLGLGVGERPWALTIYRGSLYVGYVETGETAAGPQPGIPAADADLEFHVVSAPLDTLSGWTTVLTGDLGYTKGDVYNNALAPQSRRWNTWTDTWTWAGGRVAQTNGGWHIYPQAVLSDLYFDEDGYLSLGFTDRSSIQGGNRNLASDPAVPGTNYETGANGDLLIAAPVGDGSFTLENAGAVGTRTTADGNAGEGPGGQEFYDDSLNLGNGTTHQEITLGNLAGLRGTREIVSTVYDPLAGIRLAGLMWFDVDNGDPVGGYELTPDGGSAGAAGNFQKGGGLGGISLLAAEAPVEVGNRVWFDADKDGIQDPDEPPIAGLTVQLIKEGVVIGTAVTDADGEYYFSTDPTSEFYVDGFVPNGGEYSIQFVKPDTGNLFENDPEYGTVGWNVVTFTTPEPASTEIGSNPDPTTGLYTFTVGAPGENDHSIDAGFIFDPQPAVDIEKGDGSGTTIANDADTMAEGVTYEPGESRTVVFTVTNTGTEELREVTLTDESLSGAEVQSLTWTLPNGSTIAAVDQAGVLTATWDDTFDPGTATWLPGEVITGTATLTLGASGAPHVDRAGVTAVGVFTDEPVADTDAYNAFVGDIQVIKYDGERPDPVVTDGSGWIIPSKPLDDASQDANTVDESVVYPVNTPQAVRWVVTNTGPTSLTNITLSDVTDNGPAIAADWTADLSAFGGPADYSFVASGPWPGILPPGASFFAEGTLQLAALQTHADTVDVIGTVVVPAVDGDGVPTGDPALDPEGDPVVAVDENGDPVTVDDDDPFHARTGVGPFVDIEKGDGSGTTIAHDADTMANGEVYEPGETREIVFIATNTGDEPLRNVTLTEDALSGSEVVALEWTFPDGTTATAEDIGGVLTATWEATVSGTEQWEPDDVITGLATLTIDADQVPHVDNATVSAVGADSQIPVADEDPYNAFTGAVQVIKYNGDLPDPIVEDAGNPVIPLVDADQDANTGSLAVTVKPGAPNTVRWVVTNTGTTYLTHIDLVDVTDSGASIGDDWTADLSPIGGPSNYSFVDDGPWEGLLPPGASFFAEGVLTLAAGQQHADTVTVAARVVVPATGDDGLPNGQPSVDIDGNPVEALRDGAPYTVIDNDPYHAKAPGGLAFTGWAGGTMGLALALLLLAGGALMVAARRAKRA